MVRWLDRLSGHDSEKILVNSEGQEPGVQQSMGSQTVGHSKQLSVTTTE